MEMRIPLPLIFLLIHHAAVGSIPPKVHVDEDAANSRYIFFNNALPLKKGATLVLSSFGTSLSCNFNKTFRFAASGTWALAPVLSVAEARVSLNSHIHAGGGLTFGFFPLSQPDLYYSTYAMVTAGRNSNNLTLSYARIFTRVPDLSKAYNMYTAATKLKIYKGFSFLFEACVFKYDKEKLQNRRLNYNPGLQYAKNKNAFQFALPLFSYKNDFELRRFYGYYVPMVNWIHKF